MLENRDTSGDEARPAASRAHSPLEAAVLQVLRQQGTPMTSPEIELDLHQYLEEAPGYTNLISALIHLTEQGVVLRHQDHEGFRYETTVQTPVAPQTEATPDPQVLDRLQRFLRDEA